MHLRTAIAFFVIVHASPLWPLNIQAADVPDGRRWWSHVAVLADDKLEGRNTGSPGHRRAAEYMAAQFALLGLKPAGTDGYFQAVPLVSRSIDESYSSVNLTKINGKSEPLTLGEDAMISLRVDPAPIIEADLVFAGYGLSIPEAGYDDLAGMDVRGKLVVYLSGAPPRSRDRLPHICNRQPNDLRSSNNTVPSVPSVFSILRTWTSPGSEWRWPGSSQR